jgi:hypothetical protein
VAAGILGLSLSPSPASLEGRRMNTPAHVVVNLLVLGRDRPGESAPPVVLGGLLPDLPMFVFYVVERVGLGRSERMIWGDRYFDANWQLFFDVFNSLPLIFVLAALGWALGSRFVRLLAASMLLHVALDLPLHHDDGHRHLFPVSSWRFESPISYWDPSHHGEIVALAEAFLVLVSCLVLWRRHPGRKSRPWIGGVASIYVAYLAFALVRWVGAI